MNSSSTINRAYSGPFAAGKGISQGIDDSEFVKTNSKGKMRSKKRDLNNLKHYSSKEENLALIDKREPYSTKAKR